MTGGRALAWAWALACGACSGDENVPGGADAGDAAAMDAGPRDSGPTDSGAEEGDPDCTGTPFPSVCGEDSLAVAADGAPFEVPLSNLTYDAACRASVADVVTLRIETSPAGLALTLDAGDVGTYLEAALDGRRLVGLDERNEGTFREVGDVAQTLAWPDPSGAPLGPGCLAIRPVVRSAAAGNVTARLVGLARAAPGSRLPLAVYPLEGIDLSPSELDDLMERVLTNLASAGLDAFEASRETLPRQGDTDLTLSDERQELLASLSPPAGALSLVIAGTLDAGLRTIIGAAGGIPGPVVAGTRASGVVLGIEPARTRGVLNLEQVAATATHEIGHQLGLFHVVEASGLDADLLDDTEECPRATYDTNGDGEVGATECPASVVQNRMFWMVFDPSTQVELSAEQRQALRHSVLVGD